MADESGFRGVISFLGKLGVYDVVLPFLLVFTIVFAILEKTKILGTEKIGDRDHTKKNLNAIVALAVAFLVIASTKLVGVINEVMANVVLLLVLALSFLLLVGVFFGSKEFTLEQHSLWMKFFMVFMFIGIVLIFLNALEWLDSVLDALQNWNAEWVISLVFLAIILLFIWFVTRDPGPTKNEKKT